MDTWEPRDDLDVVEATPADVAACIARMRGMEGDSGPETIHDLGGATVTTGYDALTGGIRVVVAGTDGALVIAGAGELP